MVRIKLLLLIGGIVLAYFGFQEWKLASGSESTPQSITCTDLAAKGPGNNAHVTLTNFALCSNAFVYKPKKTRKDDWSKIWVPAVPLDGEYIESIKKLVEQPGFNLNQPLPPPRDIRVIVKSSHVSNHAELEAFGDRKTLNGMVINQIESLGSEEKKILSQNYPGIDFTKCYIIDHNRKPSGAAQYGAMIGGGILLTLAGGAWMLTGLGKQA